MVFHPEPTSLVTSNCTQLFYATKPLPETSKTGVGNLLRAECGDVLRLISTPLQPNAAGGSACLVLGR
jgi:hypothetical protein